MTRGDDFFERGAEKLEALAQRIAAQGRTRLAAELHDDAEFLRKLKPSLIVERARGGNGGRSATATLEMTPAAPSGPQLAAQGGARGGPNPLLVVAAALATGILLAKAIDWRSHAHPRE